MRRIGLPASRVSNSSLFQPNSSTRDTSSSPFRTEKSFSAVMDAYLFHGQINWQSSQPYTRLPINGRSVSGILPLYSIVRYEMQRVASSRYGAIIACVGQISMHLVQLPQ